MKSTIAIIGAGSWGTALAIALAQPHNGPDGTTIHLWARNPEFAAALARERENRVYLPGLRLPETIRPTADFAAALDGAAAALLVVPSQACRNITARLAPHLPADCPLISATKGLEAESRRRMSEVMGEVLGARIPLAVLSGPSFALEVARGDPAALVLASTTPGLAEDLQRLLARPSWRLYTSADVIGVEMAGALKNVIAIAAGICAGLGLGSNAVAALIARGLAEMTRLVRALGGMPETLAGLAGLGDLVLTCTGNLSRNRALGERLGRGEGLQAILASTRMVAEGVPTTAAALQLACELGVELPITAQMQRVLFDGLSPRAAIAELMERPLKAER